MLENRKQYHGVNITQRSYHALANYCPTNLKCILTQILKPLLGGGAVERRSEVMLS